MSNCKTSLTDIGNIERDPVFLSQKAKPGGVATLDANGKVPLSQIDIVAMFTERDPVYRADRGIPFGCATLDGSTRVLREQLGSGVADSTTFLRGDGVWAVPPTGGGGSGGAAEGWLLTGTDVSLSTVTSKVVVGALPTIAKFGVKGDVASDITAIIKGAASQSVDILEVQNSTGTVLFSVSQTGTLTALDHVVTPYALLNGAGNVLFLESNDGSGATVSGSNSGKLRYNDTTGYWEWSTKGNPYVPIGDIHDIFRYSMLHNLA